MRKLKKYKPTKFMAKTSHYDKDAADYAVMFIESLCHTKGTWAGKPFELIDWQEQIIRDLFGVLKPNGYRQFNTAYIEIPKKQGKSELAAAVALLLLCGDGEERAEVYGCAADRNQAKIVFDVAVDMVRFCPALSKRVKILESQKKITYLPTNSSYQVLSADVANKHGFNTHGVIFDELHTQPNRKLFDVMLQGSGDARMPVSYTHLRSGRRCWCLWRTARRCIWLPIWKHSPRANNGKRWSPMSAKGWCASIGKLCSLRIGTAWICSTAAPSSPG